MVEQRRPKRFRVSSEHENGDICAFETDDREQAEPMRAQFAEDLDNVTFDKQKRL